MPAGEFKLWLRDLAFNREALGGDRVMFALADETYCTSVQDSAKLARLWSDRLWSERGHR